jgi:hypothetical protein
VVTQKFFQEAADKNDPAALSMDAGWRKVVTAWADELRADQAGDSAEPIVDPDTAPMPSPETGPPAPKPSEPVVLPKKDRK